MKLIALLLFSSFSCVAFAEEPLVLGLRGAIKQLEGVSEETARPAQTAALQMLGHYARPYGQGHLLQYAPAAGNTWIEVKDLKILGVSANTVTDADRANGTRQSISVRFTSEMYRMRNPSATTWGQWLNGHPGMFPSTILVTQDSSGHWTATNPYFKYLAPIGQRGTIKKADDALPPGMSRPSSGAPVSPIPSAPRVPPIAPPLKQETSVEPLAQPALPSTAQSTPPVKQSPILPVVPYIVGACFILAALPLATKKRRRHISPNRTVRSATPPSLPAALRGNLIDLIERRANLMTPAELTFYSVLASVVGSSFMISSKVRLADIFQLRSGPGQQAAFNKIVGKHIDFVITHPATSRILCGIELDDRSHQLPERMERDRFVNDLFANNHLSLLRIPVARFYDPVELKAQLLAAGVFLP